MRNGRVAAITFLVIVILGGAYYLNPFSTKDTTYRVVNTYPHDQEAFTQGLIYHDGELFEGTGLYERSSLRRVDLETGEVLQIIDLPPDVFGEGITILDDRIYMLTWREWTCYVYDLDFELQETFSYPTEGWGLTNNGNYLIMSDGSSKLRLINPDTFQVTKTITVSYNGKPVDNLNELEYVDGIIYANIWLTDQIALIDAMSGNVIDFIDFSSLKDELDTDQIDVLNGIAYNPEKDTFYITGKLWPMIFEVELISK